MTYAWYPHRERWRCRECISSGPNFYLITGPVRAEVFYIYDKGWRYVLYDKREVTHSGTVGTKETAMDRVQTRLMEVNDGA